MKHRWGKLSALLVSLALFGAACTQDAPDAEPEVTPATSDEEGGAPSATASPVFAPGDDVLEVAINEPASLDPMRIGDPGSVLVARQLFESLTGWDPIEEEVFPAAAERWTTQQGGRRFVFHLRPGATFHDGTPVRASDFVFAFNRIARKSNGSELAYILERVSGFVAVNQLGDTNRLAGLKAPAENRLVIELTEPFHDLPALLTHPGLVPVPRKAVTDDRYLTAPIGNGPFEMAEAWAPGESVTLERFEGFFRTPPLEGIRFTTFPDAASSWLDFTAGDFHVAEVPADQIEAAAATFGEEGFKPLLAGYYFGFNLDSPSLGSRRLRKAISIGIDREFIASEIYRGTLQPPRGIVPVGMPGFQFDVCADLCRYDPIAAAALVRRLPRDSRRVTIEYTQGHPHGRVATAVKQDLEDIGLQVRIRSFGFRQYLRRLRQGNQEVYRLGWIAEYPVPEVFLNALFGSESPDNHSGYGSQRVDKILRRARGTASAGKREQLYIKAEQIIIRSLPIVPIGSFVTHWATQPSVQDLNFDAMGGFDAFGVSLAPESTESP